MGKKIDIIITNNAIQSYSYSKYLNNKLDDTKIYK